MSRVLGIARAMVYVKQVFYRFLVLFLLMTVFLYFWFPSFDC